MTLPPSSIYTHPAWVVGWLVGGAVTLLGLRTHFYKEFEMNARNQTWDLLLQRPYNDGGGENSTRVDGTLLGLILMTVVGRSHGWSWPGGRSVWY